MVNKDLNEQSSEILLQRIRAEILPLFDRFSHDDSVSFQNSHLKSCWEERDCQKENCPIFNEVSPRCWQVTGTYCGGKAQGAFVDKYHNCKECEVFKDACPTILEELGEHFNNMIFLLHKRDEKVKKQILSIDHLNKELRSSLEDLDSRNMEIQKLMITDKLTGLYNRHYMMTVLGDEIMRYTRKGYEFSVMMLDIDDFKSTNDTYGHIFGDEVLSTLSRILKKKIRNYDRAFRFGGEEFLVVLPDTDQTISWVVAERVREAFAGNKFTIASNNGEEEVVCTVSIGLSRFTENLDINKLLDQADKALYEAKRRGKNRVIRYTEI